MGDSASHAGMVGRPETRPELSRKERRTGRWSEKEEPEGVMVVLGDVNNGVKERVGADRNGGQKPV